MPIDLASVDRLYVVVLALIVFIACLLGNLLLLHPPGMAALLSALLFACGFVFWTYYPHGLPLPTTIATQKTAGTPAAPAPAAPAAPQRPRNPVTDVTPPRNPITDVTPQR